jgi:hypothetical protein
MLNSHQTITIPFYNVQLFVIASLATNDCNTKNLMHYNTPHLGKQEPGATFSVVRLVWVRI